jgi:hypothetical protein
MTKFNSSNPSREAVEWARRVNSRWLVHEGLDVTARDFMNHLAVVDPERLRKSCEMAQLMVSQSRGVEDPKPRFYGGLFSLATAKEAECFFADRLFIAALWPGGDFVPHEGLGPETVQKMAALREEILQTKKRIQS